MVQKIEKITEKSEEKWSNFEGSVKISYIFLRFFGHFFSSVGIKIKGKRLGNGKIGSNFLKTRFFVLFPLFPYTRFLSIFLPKKVRKKWAFFGHFFSIKNDEKKRSKKWSKKGQKKGSFFCYFFDRFLGSQNTKFGGPNDPQIEDLGPSFWGGSRGSRTQGPRPRIQGPGSGSQIPPDLGPKSKFGQISPLSRFPVGK